jgi:hypothetical protein
LLGQRAHASLSIPSINDLFHIDLINKDPQPEPRVSALAAETLDGDTLLRGAVADRAALHGVLAHVEALGLELLEFRRLPPRAGYRPESPGRVTPAHPAGHEA